MTDIKFGTDGWRAVMGEDFNFDNVSRVIQAFCDVHVNAVNKLVYVGFDRRRDSDVYADLVAQVLAANDFKVRLAKTFCPTPCVSWLVKTQGGLAGIMVTASHNPSKWNGIKFKESYGGAASPAYTDKIENKIREKIDQAVRPYPSFLTLNQQGKIELFDPQETYVKHLRSFVAVEQILKSGFKIAVDSLYGAGTGYIQNVLQEPVLQIHGEADPEFGGLNPEPIAKNLQDFSRFVLEHHADVGLATDGDADRIGAIDENGQYVNSHQIFALLLKHHVSYRRLRGAVVKSVSASQWIDRIAAKYGMTVVETKIGFKYISQELLKRDAMMGGEESGGISLREHVHERDGVLNGLMLVEMMAIHKKRLTGLIADMTNEFGELFFDRNDYHLSPEKIGEVRTALAHFRVREIMGQHVVRVNALDGTKIIFKDAWLLIRASGTEPLLRVYAEAPTPDLVQGLLGFARDHFKLRV